MRAIKAIIARIRGKDKPKTHIDNAVIARYKVKNPLKKSHSEESFEIYVYLDKAIDLKKGKNIPMSDVLAESHIYKDAKKGMLASEHEMETVFGSSETDYVARQIITKGEIQTTSEFREHKIEEKKKQLIAMIHRNAIDPRSNLPHPITRIENAFKEAKIKIDANKSAEEQFPEVIKKLNIKLPLKIETKQLQVFIDDKYAIKVYGNIKKLGTLVKDSWGEDGEWHGIIEVPAGIYQDVIDKLNELTKGHVEIKILKK